jgi:3',5'-nucleoside bisphosphate phosphatase
LRYDLHMHSTASDGALSPEELVKLAVKVGVDGIALTDHDTVSGLKVAREAAEAAGIGFVNGIELSIQEAGEDIHMLGYFIQPDDELKAILGEISDMRVRRAEIMVEKLEALDKPIEMEAVLRHANGGEVGRPHIAAAIVEAGHARTNQTAFDLYIGNDGPAYAPKSLMDAERGMNLLHSFGAVPVMAHPALYDYKKVMARFLDLGLAGLEVDHPSHSLWQCAELRALAAELGLVTTGGSDFHAPGHPMKVLGSHGVSGAMLDALKARRPRS